MTAENAAVKDVEMVEMIDSNLSTPPYAHRDDVDTRNVEKGNHGHGTIDLSDDDYIVTVKTWVVVTVIWVDTFGV